MMAIAPPTAPGAIARAALQEASLARGLNQPQSVASALVDVGGGRKAEAAAADPLPVYSIPIEDLAHDRHSHATDAIQHGWRVRTVDSHGEQLVDLAREGAPVAVRRGVSGNILARAADLAESTADPGVDYEARLLDFGQLGLSALWLHHDADDDRFYILGRQPRELKEDELISEAERRARRFLRQRPASSEVADPGG
jgi:hypothetical protein